MLQITARKLLQMDVTMVCALDTSVLLDCGVRSLRKDQLDGVPLDTPIVVYCAAWSCGAGKAFGKELTSRGFTCVYDYVGGLSEWILLSRTDPGTYRLKDAQTGEPASEQSVNETFDAMHHQYFEKNGFRICGSKRPPSLLLLGTALLLFFRGTSPPRP